jgi:N-acetylglucosamine-6-phosphate deacetylase
MVVLTGADLVLPDRVLPGGTIVIENDRILDVRPEAPGGHPSFAFRNHFIVPGFVDVHVHGVDGVDALDDAPHDESPIGRIASRLPRYGVTAFCPTTVACDPGKLRGALEQIRRLREHPPANGARVVGAHLESNFLNPEFAGAQPRACLRRPIDGLSDPAGGLNPGGFTAAEILREIDRAAPDVSIVTVAPELDGGLDLVRWLNSRGRRVSLGHSAADYDLAVAAISAGARHATHLFNRMRPLHHRRPGLVGAVLQTDEVAAELICDGVHVHPAVVRAVIDAKQPSHVMAITDATAAAGLPRGAAARLGGQRITAGADTALLDDGTVAGSILTMDRAFSTLVGSMGLSLVAASTVCSTTPARELGLVGCGVLAAEAFADIVVLDANFSVVQTYVAGQLVYSREPAAAARG